jgi:hypothetical protein
MLQVELVPSSTVAKLRGVSKEGSQYRVREKAGTGTHAR